MGKSTDFYVAEDLPIGVDGFLGAEFLKTYNAKIDYEHNTIRFKTGRMCKTTNTENFALFTSRCDEENQPELIFPVSAKDNSYSFVAPARCEIFKKILTNLNTDCVIRKQEVANGVFVAETIVRPRNGEIFVKILNTRNEEVKISNFRPIVEEAQNYEICCFSHQKGDSERTIKLMNILKLEDLNIENKNSIQSICQKYADVFYMDGDAHTSTNLYEQSIKLKSDATPIFKNHIGSHTAKRKKWTGKFKK